MGLWGQVESAIYQGWNHFCSPWISGSGLAWLYRGAIVYRCWNWNCTIASIISQSVHIHGALTPYSRLHAGYVFRFTETYSHMRMRIRSRYLEVVPLACVRTLALSSSPSHHMKSRGFNPTCFNFPCINRYLVAQKSKQIFSRNKIFFQLLFFFFTNFLSTCRNVFFVWFHISHYHLSSY